MKILGHGVDLTSIEEIVELMARTDSDFSERCFTEAERQVGQSLTKSGEWYAGRFAAKEAIAKALGTGFDDTIAPIEIEILSKPSGEPVVSLNGSTAHHANNIGVVSWKLSISHANGMAIASAIACG